jgi:protein kinase A
LQVVEDKTFTVCGTPEYIAGEVISGRGHGIPVDYWSLGVLIYEMLAGLPPFRGDTNYKLFEVILACQYKMPPEFAPEAAALVAGLLQSDPTRRLGAMKNGAADLKRHPFFAATDWPAVLAAEQTGPLGQIRVVQPTKVAPGPEFSNFS